jgi:hypothetical protein
MTSSSKSRGVSDPAARNRSEKPRALITLATIAGGLVAMATLLGFVLHGCGHVAYTTYLGAWGVQDGLFPQSADWKVVRGYYAIVLQGSELLTDVPWSKILAVFAFLSLAIFLMNMPGGREAPVNRWFEAQHFLVREVLKALFGSAAVIYVAATLILVGTLLALIPGWLGERAGQRQAEREKTALSDIGAPGQSELWMGDKLYLQGRIIAASEQLIAVYDSKLKSMRVIERSGFEIRASQGSSASPATP